MANDDSFNLTSWKLVGSNDGDISKFVHFFTANSELKYIEALFLNPFSTATVEL